MVQFYNFCFKLGKGLALSQEVKILMTTNITTYELRVSQSGNGTNTSKDFRIEILWKLCIKTLKEFYSL